MNGFAAAMSVSGIVAACSLLLSARVAMGLSMALIFLAHACLLFLHDQTPVKRVEMNFSISLGVLFFVQVATRFWTEMARQLQRIGTDMSRLVSGLDADLLQARIDHEQSNVTDAATGLPNRVGFVQLADKALAPSGTGGFALVASIRQTNASGMISDVQADARAALVNAIVWNMQGALGSDILVASTGTGEFALLVTGNPRAARAP